MASPWCENAEKGIRPLVGVKNPKIGVDDTADNSKNRSVILQISESPTPNIGVFENDLLQKSEFALKEYKEPFKDQNFSDNNNNENKPVVVVVNDKRKSQFSLEECLRYVQICETKSKKSRASSATESIPDHT